MSRNKRTLQLILVAALALMALYFLLGRSGGTMNGDLRDFTVTDTALIDKIVLHHGETGQVVLERKADSWMVNGQFKAESHRVMLLMSTLKHIIVKSPVSRQCNDSLAQQLRNHAIKVELYTKGKRVKSFFVGGSTTNTKATYMMNSKADKPFLVELPGFNGALSPRFSSREEFWKGQVVFNYAPNQIASLTVQYPHEPESSFSITANKGGYRLFNLLNRQTMVAFDTLELKLFLNEFRFKKYQAKIDSLDETQKQEILSLEPFCVLLVQTIEGESQQLLFYERTGRVKTDVFGQELSIDPDYFYIQTDKKELLMGQYYEFDPILRSLQSFLKD